MAAGSDTSCNPARGRNDSTWSAVGTVLSAAAIAAAAYNTVQAVKIAQDEWTLAKKYWRIAQDWLDYYKDYYAPVEDQEVSEALALQKDTPIYETARGRARTIAWLEFRGVLDKAVRCTSRYCAGLRADMLADISAAQAASVSLADGLGYRNERAYIESRDDVRFDKKFNTAKRGRDMISDNVSLAKATAGIYGDLFDQAWAGLSGAGQYLGYHFNRNQTIYPTAYLQNRAQFQRTQDGGSMYAESPRFIGPPEPGRTVVEEALADIRGRI